MRCTMCGDNFSGKIMIGDKWSRKEKKSKYCQVCVDIKGNTHAATFIKHAKKIAAWQAELPAYLESLNTPFPCVKCGEQHMTRPGGPAMCKSCLSVIKEEKRIAREKEKKRLALLEKEQEIQRKKNHEKAKKRNKLKEEIIIALEGDDSFRKHLFQTKWSSRYVFLKEEIRIGATDCSVERWDKKFPGAAKNSWRPSNLYEIAHRLPADARKIVEDNPDLF